jgi:hypothetical protein
VLHFTIGASSPGKVLVVTSEKGVCAVLLGSEDKSLIADLKGRDPGVVLIESCVGTAASPAIAGAFSASVRFR